jgi:hypothetical protein
MNKTGHALDDLHADALKPALVSIPNACKYMGNVSRAKFYSGVLPQLETVYVGTRRFVVVASMDRLIAKLLGKDVSAQNGLPAKPRRVTSPKSHTAANAT